ncbi:MAG: hypothetical protein VX768_10530 [Planctomycetota bacterium]|nr:hypothetical protein [Planctomycetota bacterium]
MNQKNTLRKRLKQLIECGCIDDAVDELTAALKLDPDNGNLHQLLGMTYHLKNDNREAMNSLETASLLKPLEVDSQLTLAECYAEENFKLSAVCIFTFLMKQENLPGEFYPAIARGLGRLGHPRQAMKACESAVRLQPECDRALFGLAHYRAVCGHPLSSVVGLLRKAISLASDSLEYRIVAARLCLISKKREEAASFLSPITRQQILNNSCSACITKLCRLASFLKLHSIETLCQQRLDH